MSGFYVFESDIINRLRPDINGVYREVPFHIYGTRTYNQDSGFYFAKTIFVKVSLPPVILHVKVIKLENGNLLFRIQKCLGYESYIPRRLENYFLCTYNQNDYDNFSRVLHCECSLCLFPHQPCEQELSG